MTTPVPAPTHQIEPWLLEILRCPVGLQPVQLATDSAGNSVLMCCADCPDTERRHQYPIENGIPVMLPESAVVVATPES